MSLMPPSQSRRGRSAGNEYIRSPNITSGLISDGVRRGPAGNEYTRNPGTTSVLEDGVRRGRAARRAARRAPAQEPKDPRDPRTPWNPFGQTYDTPKYGSQGQGLDSYNAAMAEILAAKAAAEAGVADAYGGLGGAGMNAVGQYGSQMAGALANSNVAAGNTFGGMANSYYNTLGQMGHIGGALSAAGLAASSNATNANMLRDMNMGGGMGGGGGYGGFEVSGPGGRVASGSMGGGPGRGGRAGMNTGNSQGSQVQSGGDAYERRDIMNQGFGFLGGAMGTLNDPRNPAGVLAGMAEQQFNQNREAMTDPRFLNTMTGMFRDSKAGIDSRGDMQRKGSALGGLNDSVEPSYRSSKNSYPSYHSAQSKGQATRRKF